MRKLAWLSCAGLLAACDLASGPPTVEVLATKADGIDVALFCAVRCESNDAAHVEAQAYRRKSGREARLERSELLTFSSLPSGERTRYAFGCI